MTGHVHSGYRHEIQITDRNRLGRYLFLAGLVGLVALIMGLGQ